jgi:hypothetical protein
MESALMTFSEPVTEVRNDTNTGVIHLISDDVGDSVETWDHVLHEDTFVEGLRAEIISRLEDHKQNGRKAAEIILDTLDNAIRIGWALLDIRKELKKAPGAYHSFIELNLPIGVSQANLYAQISRSFDRDEANVEFTRQLRDISGLDPLLIEVSVEKSLKQQIIEVNASSFADLMRVAGIAKGKTLALSTGNRQEKPAFLKLGKSISMTIVRMNRLNKLSPISGWGEQEKRAIKDDLKPLVDLYATL